MSTNFEDLIMRDTRANQPAAGVPGRLYYVTDEDVLERDNGSLWESVEGSGSGAVGEIDDLSDVTISSPADDEVLAYDNASGEWINQTPAEAGLSEDGHSHTESDITDLDHTDEDAIHDNVAGEIAAITEKASPVAADKVLIEDSEDADSKKFAELGNLPGGDGDVSGPASSTDNAIARFDGAGGKTIQNSSVTIDDNDDLQMADNLIVRPVIKDYGETVNAIGSIGGGTQDIDLELGNVVTATVDTSETTFTFSNPPASGTAGSFTLILTNGGSQTANWPASVDWEDGSAPTLTSSGVDVLSFLTVDGGTTWYGFVGGLNFS